MSETRRLLSVLVVLSWPVLSQAHPDDPKVLDRIPRYEGPGYRYGSDADRSSGRAAEFDSEGMFLWSWISLPEFGNQSTANDCWGYVSPSGREYAIIGLRSGTGFVEVTDPRFPVIVRVLGGPTSIWRDIKVYQQYAYAVSEAGQGIQVFDLGQIDDGIVTKINTVTTGGTTATHNVAIDVDSGFLYRSGGSNEGIRVYDLADPTNPTYVGFWSDRYCHDVQAVTYTDGPYAGREIVFCNGGFNGGYTQTGLVILDVTDKQNIQQLSVTLYGSAGYAHQGWLSPDRQYYYLNDELDERNGLTATTTTRVIDVSDLANPVVAGSFTNGNTSIDHNLYTVGNLIYEANYRSGIRIFDATDPVNPVEIAHFDTFPNSDSANFNGLWSNYPFLPSGTIIGSDIERGLFVWSLGTPDLLPPAPAPAPYDVVKNRYISFYPNNLLSVALQVELTSSEYFPDAVGVLGWVGAPDANGVSRIVDQPVYRVWPEAVVHVADCGIVPVAAYAIRAAEEGVPIERSSLSPPLEVATIAHPTVAAWADSVGPFDGTSWTAPDGVTNFDDVSATIRAFQALPSAPDMTRVDLHGAEVTGDETIDPPNEIINFSDVQAVIKAFGGEPYPYENPLFCP